MFTGLIKEIGLIKNLQSNNEGILIGVESKKLIQDINIDDSVSINGACQTVVEIKGNVFYVQAVHVTLEKTNFKTFVSGTKVNLELACRANDFLGGHIVQGHINTTAKLNKVIKRGMNYELFYEVPSQFIKYCVEEGSIAIDGISLTIARVDLSKGLVGVSIIPHTYENTIIHTKKTGDWVNLEFDILIKYLESLITRGKEKVDLKQLHQWGY
jgi:riboflavin synthase